MFRATRKLIAPLIVLALSCSLGNAGQTQKRQPLTNFEPSKDFFQVPNERGDCLGIVESAITHWIPQVPEHRRLAKLGDMIRNLGKNVIDVNGETQGERFLKDINTYAQHHSARNANTAPQTGKYLAEVMMRTIESTKTPQVLGVDLVEGKRHALVVYDAQKLNGKIVFKVGDPNYPANNKLTLEYDQVAGRWTQKNFPEDSNLTKRFTPHIIHWDAGARKIAEIPRIETLGRLLTRVHEVVNENKPLMPGSAEGIGKELGLLEPVKWNPLPTAGALDQLPPTQAEIDSLNAAVAAYEKAVAEHNRRVETFASVNQTFADDGRVHISYADKFNASAKKYNGMAQRTETEFNRLRSIRDTIARKSTEFAQRYRGLFSRRESLGMHKRGLDARRTELIATAKRLQLSVMLPVAIDPVTLASMPSVTLEQLERPAAEHPFVGTWKITTGISKGTVWTCQPGGGFSDSGYPTPGSWESTGPNSAKVTLTYDSPGLAFTCTYDVTILNGQADVTWSTRVTRGTGGPYPDSGSFKLGKQ